jgi:diguanylate cyclase (GGDEF)-like protein
VIVASLDPHQLVKFYETIDVGRDGAIVLLGLDGYVRASRGLKTEKAELLPAASRTRSALEDSPTGSFVGTGLFDGVVRIVSYRRVKDLPLVVTVALSKQEALAIPLRNQVKYYSLASGATLLTLIAMALGIAHRRKLDLVNNQLRHSEAVARERSQELRTTLDNIDQGIFMSDGAGNLHVINRRAIELLDLPREWLHTRPNLKSVLKFLVERGEFGKDGEQLDKSVWENIKSGGVGIPVIHFERTRPNGTVLEINARRLPDGGMVRTFADITERKCAEAKVARMATHDELTGLSNRTLFRERVSHALERTWRDGESFAILLIDLDRFKEINDTCGHPAGDAVLKEAARRFSLCIREPDTVARLGGDEFAILQSRIRKAEDAELLAQRIIRTLRAPFELEGEEVFLATSIGIAIAPGDGTDYETLTKRADKALYRAKDRGGNLFCFHTPAATLQPSSSQGERVPNASRNEGTLMDAFDSLSGS